MKRASTGAVSHLTDTGAAHTNGRKHARLDREVGSSTEVEVEAATRKRAPRDTRRAAAAHTDTRSAHAPADANLAASTYDLLSNEANNTDGATFTAADEAAMPSGASTTRRTAAAARGVTKAPVHGDEDSEAARTLRRLVGAEGAGDLEPTTVAADATAPVITPLSWEAGRSQLSSGRPLAAAHSSQSTDERERVHSMSSLSYAIDDASSGDGKGVAVPSVSSSAVGAPAVAAAPRIVWVRRPNRPEWTPLTARGDTLIGFLVKDIKKELPSLSSVDSDSILLRPAGPDGVAWTAKGADGTETAVVLDSRDTLDEALAKASTEAGRDIAPDGRLHIVVEAAAPAPAPTPAGPWFPDRTDNVDVRDPTIVHRRVTCAWVFQQLEDQPVRQLRAPPGSGKTALGQLLIAAAPDGRTVKMLNANAFVRMGDGATAEQLWTAQMREVMAESLDPLAGPLRMYIVDEVQLLYKLGPDSSFWRAVKQIAGTAPTECRVQLLLMGTYGLQAGKLVGTPVELRSPWSLKLLLLSDEELIELFSAFNYTCPAHGYPVVSSRLQAAMERVCGRHVGLLRAALRLFMIAFKGKRVVTREQEAELIASQLVSMGRGSDLRALPKLADVSEEERGTLVKVALAGPDGLQMPCADTVAPPRLISAGVLDVECPGPGQPDVLRFSSPAMRAHALFNLGVRPELALPHEVLSDPASFVRAAVKRMRSSELSGSASKAVSSDAPTSVHGAKAPKTSLLERQYQMSFYSAAVALLPAGVFMSPDFGPVEEVTNLRKGYIDFFVNGSHRIGIEIMRDGKGGKEHSARFNAGTGTYAPLKLRSWVVVDFRHSKPRTKQIKGGIVYVVLSEDFARATIMQEDRADEHVTLSP